MRLQIRMASDLVRAADPICDVCWNDQNCVPQEEVAKMSRSLRQRLLSGGWIVEIEKCTHFEGKRD